MNKLVFLFFFTFSEFVFAQSTGEISFFADILGKRGTSLVIGAIFFFFAYKNSIKLFQWIEDQTYGTRDYVLQKAELLHIEVEPNRVTYALLFLTFGLGVLTIGFFALFGKFVLGLFMGLTVGIIGWKTPRPFMDYLVERRIKVYSGQVVDALNLLSNGLRAGLSVPQGLAMVVDEMPEPVSQEFNSILQQTRIGVPLEEAFEGLVKRVPTEDNEMFVSSVNILRETGGNLSEVFDTITDVIRERVRLQQKIDTYTAQGMFQGMTIAAMPFVMGFIQYSSSPEATMLLFSNIVGNFILIAALLLDAAGVFLIMRIVKIRV